MKLELSILAGAESKAFLADLSKIVERMENAVGYDNARKSQPTKEVEEEEEPAPKAAKSKKASSFDEDEEQTVSARESDLRLEEDEEDFKPKAAQKKKVASSFDESEEDEAPKHKQDKKTKSKKVTIDDVNDAAMARAGRTNRAEVLAILKKNFKVKSITDLDESNYAECISLLGSKK